MVVGTAEILRGNHGNSHHIHGNTVGSGSPLTGLAWGCGAMQSLALNYQVSII